MHGSFNPRTVPLGTTSAAALMSKVLPDVRHVVPGYIPEGLTLFGGKPKLGKSWFLLGCGIAVASGGYALGKVPVEQGDVLYLALEDNERRLQRRLKQLCPTGQVPGRLFYDLTCRRLDQGLLDDLRAWIVSAHRPRLVIVDVLNKVKPAQKPNEGIYDYDVRCLGGLQELAAEYQLAIVVVHHTRKAEAEDPFDCLSGSTGLTGTADTTLVLSRDSQGTTLYGRGRDIDEIETALSFDRSTGAWTAMGAAPEVRRSDTRKAIVTALSQAGRPLSPREVADLTGLEHDNTRQVLTRMAEKGEVERAGTGRYTAPSYPPVTPVTGVTARTADDYRRAKDGENVTHLFPVTAVTAVTPPGEGDRP